MHIAVVDQFYRFPGEGGKSRFNEFVKHWRSHGHEVTVLTSQVHQFTAQAEDGYRGQFTTVETGPEGERVVRSWTKEGDRDSTAGRIAEYMSFAASASLASLRHVPEPDVVIATSPPLPVGLPGVAIKWFKCAPLVLEVRDLWPDFAVQIGMLQGAVTRRLAYGLESFLYQRAEHVVGVTPAYLDVLEEKGVPREKLSYVPNGADLDDFQPGPRHNEVRKRHVWSDDFVVAYVGTHGDSHGLEQLLDAAEILQRTRPDVQVVLVGDGPAKPGLVADAKERDLENVEFVDRIPREEVPSYIQAADAGVAVLRDLPGFKLVYPTKIFDYMSCARPIVLGVAGAARELVEEAQAGISAPPEDAESLAEVITSLAEDPEEAAAMGKRGFAFVQDRFDRKDIADRYLDMLEELAAI